MTKVAKTIKITIQHEDWLKSNQINFSEWIRKKLDEEIENINKKVLPKKFKAIILAAGKDPLLFPLTEDIPKTMLNVKGKTILQRQIEMLRMFGIQDIAVVRGYKKEQISYPNLVYFDNDDYEKTGSLVSLFHAKDFMDCDCIIIYGDLLFNKEVLKKLISAQADNILVVDRGWKKHYQESQEKHPFLPELTALFDQGKNVAVRTAGVGLPETESTTEFIGLSKISLNACSILNNLYENVYSVNHNKRFHHAKRIHEASLIDFFQELINQGEKISALEIWRNWIDVDTFEDYRKAWKFINE